MSRVHDALRRAEQGALSAGEEPVGARAEAPRLPEFLPVNRGIPAAAARLSLDPEALRDVPTVAFNPAPESHLLDLNTSHETPAEEFRTLRTRLNHLQTLQPLHTIVVTSPSPAEGKTFSSVNLALAQAHLTESSVLLAISICGGPSSTTCCKSTGRPAFPITSPARAPSRRRCAKCRAPTSTCCRPAHL